MNERKLFSLFFFLVASSAIKLDGKSNSELPKQHQKQLLRTFYKSLFKNDVTEEERVGTTS